MAPTIENEPGQRMAPPVSVTLMFGRLESSMPMLTALVTIWMPSRWRRLRATWVVVVPGESAMVSPSATMAAAASAILRFSSAKRASRRGKAASKRKGA